jgi:hypothetical protein
MDCLDIRPGAFETPGSWQNDSSVTTINQVTVRRDAMGCTVNRGLDELPRFILPANGDVRYLIFGNPLNFVAIFTLTPISQLTATYTVEIIDTSGAILSSKKRWENSPVERLTTGEPIIQTSAGNGSVFLLYLLKKNAQGHIIKSEATFFRSDNGAQIGTPISFLPFSSGLFVTGRATGSILQILDNGVVIHHVDAVAVCKADTLNFQAIIGAADPTLATPTKTATISNNGANCLKINGIASASPFEVTAAPSFPVTLNQGPTISIDVRFNASQVGTADADLLIDLVPGTSGDNVVQCHGTVRQAVSSVSFSPTLSFGTVRVGSTETMPLVIENTGESIINLRFTTQPVDSRPHVFFQEFKLATNLHLPFDVTILPGLSVNIPISFTPGPQDTIGILTFNSNASSSPHTVTLSGERDDLVFSGDTGD